MWNYLPAFLPYICNDAVNSEETMGLVKAGIFTIIKKLFFGAILNYDKITLKLTEN
jgi:hypothetical protein